ncbi:DUF2156 domain-containing protein [bacterium]|nr:DUF2156 domain-containing protein [bacterium]
MNELPKFPYFKYLSLEDRPTLNHYLKTYPSDASDYTFTNMFIWRSYYQVQWSILDNWLLILYNPMHWGYYFLQPIGPPSRYEVTKTILEWLRDEMDEPEARIDRGDEKYFQEIDSKSSLTIEAVRDQYDYVYQRADLVHLSGRKYHNKKNHVNKFQKSFDFIYEPLTNVVADECIHVLKKWCNWRECEKNLLMRAEFEAVYEALCHYNALNITGGLIRVNGIMEAFAMGEMMNEDTAVIHVEKANPDLQGSFAIINQQFAEKEWHNAFYINREQDLGVEGLRKAKMSYNPHHMVKKYRIRLMD